MLENFDDSDSAVIGFMFDNEHSKTCKVFNYENIAIKIKTIDENPGHVQSGLYLWPAGNCLCKHLHFIWNEIQTDFILELGSGCGLSGIFVSKLPGVKTVILTDYDPGSIKILEENVGLNNDSTTSSNCLVKQFSWGCENDIDIFKYICQRNENSFKLIIGSDLIYCKDVIYPLLFSVANLLSDVGIFILASSFDIGSESQSIMENQCKQLGLDLVDIKPLDIMPRDDYSGFDNKVYSKIQYITKCSKFDVIYDEYLKKSSGYST